MTGKAYLEALLVLAALSVIARISSSRIMRNSWPSDSNFSSGILANQNVIPFANSHLYSRSVIQNLAIPNRYGYALLRFLFAGVRNHNSATDDFFRVDSFHDDSVMQGSQLHKFASLRKM